MAIELAREVRLDTSVELPAGTYRLGEPGEERSVRLSRVLIGRWPVTNAQARRFVAASGLRVDAALAVRLEASALAEHPVTGLSLAEAEAFCAWAQDELGRTVRLPSGDEWEALARGEDGRAWPWGDSFDADRCACDESGWGWTVPVTAHPEGAGPFGAEQQAGNVWEWVADRTPEGWGVVRGGSWLDHEWGVRASRTLAADPRRGTETTGFRLAFDIDTGGDGNGRRA
jgi:formylglycine-generating enzyme required for sulfatase activity